MLGEQEVLMAKEEEGVAADPVVVVVSTLDNDAL